MTQVVRSLDHSLWLRAKSRPPGGKEEGENCGVEESERGGVGVEERDKRCGGCGGRVRDMR